MSIICQNFVQNAWRSDLCSNCFKSLEDHSSAGGRATCDRLSMPRYVPQATTLYQSRGISTSLQWRTPRLSESLYDRMPCRDFGSQTLASSKKGNKGILIKDNVPGRKLRRSSSVGFASEEALIIGYGGNDYDSDSSPWEMGSDDGSINLELLDVTDEDRTITKLTRNNTEFNSSNRNLLSGCDSGKRTTKEEERMNTINNNLTTSTKSIEKNLNQSSTDKKLAQYYFAMTRDPIKSYLHNNHTVIVRDSPNRETPKKESEAKPNSNSRVMLSEDYTPLNTTTYSFVSQINKKETSGSFDQSSDSDYSTSRQTTGDSTDSESMHEEPRVHETFPKQDDKKYDAGSSTSGDVSNFSDDSDATPAPERSSGKNRNSKPPKGSCEAPSTTTINVANDQRKNAACRNDANETLQRGRASVEDVAPDVIRRDETAENTCQVETCPREDTQLDLISSCAPEENTSPFEGEDDPAEDDSSKILNTDLDKSTDNDRQSKLAALALELEQARRNSISESSRSAIPPEPKIKYTPTATPKTSTPVENHYPSIRKSSAIPCTSRFASLPDVLQETPVKPKKNKFSLKKLLKRNKDSGTFTVNNTSNAENNPKAWKKQNFDRSRLSLEIVHPMDMFSDPPSSTDITPTDDRHGFHLFTDPAGKVMFKGVSSRARSLSALPHLPSSIEDCGERRNMGAVPTRKAGTVAERKKKSRPPLVRTPSCSALHNRPLSGEGVEGGVQRPPKPPPPPKCKSMQPPPPPPPQMRSLKPGPNSGPVRPPPPKIPEDKSPTASTGQDAQSIDTREYANLGDIRSLLTPKKPERPSAFSVAREDEMDQRDNYEDLRVADEEDHYTYLDEMEMRASKKETAEVSKARETSSEMFGAGQRPWLDLQTSYAAIAAANYESLAELITKTLSEEMEYFQKAIQSLKWKDFELEKKEPSQVVGDKVAYDAIHKSQPHTKLTLLVTPQKQPASQSHRNLTRMPILASFTDQLPGSVLARNDPDPTKAFVFVLQRCRITTINQFAETTSRHTSDQHVHLRNDCFVLLQLIHTLKNLQAEGIEEINYDVGRILLVSNDDDKPPVLILLPGDKFYLTQSDYKCRKTLCQATLHMMLYLLQIDKVQDLERCTVNGERLAEPVAHTFTAIAKVLTEEKASSLSQAKGLLEYMLWGPVDVKISNTDIEESVEVILQRWLDLQRAQMVKSLVSNLHLKSNSQIGLHIYEEYQLVFLLQATVKSLKDIISKL